MRRLERRAIICLALAMVLFIGLGVFVYRFFVHGAEWATFYGNQNLYTGEALSSGKIYDRNGILLMESGDGEVWYNDDYSIRRGTLHAVGDTQGNISTSALVAYRSKIIGYNPITGTYKITGRNEDLTLTIDAEASSVAYQWLSEYDAGCVGVYNYKTGEVLCAVSTPGFDPMDPPVLEEGDDSGIYINRFFSSTITPGSIFKTVTAAAEIEKAAWQDFRYTCYGEREVGDEYVTCMQAHGEQDLQDALANSCNCAFSYIAEELGEGVMIEYVDKLGLTKVYDMSGIKNAAGSFSFPTDSPIDLSWAGVGQYMDELNPCSMMIYMGAIASEGTSAVPKMLVSDSILYSVFQEDKLDMIRDKSVELLEPTTASVLRNMMKYNVTDNYGTWNFPGLELGAKTGTGEVEDRYPNATFAGFLDDSEHPYAFIVCVENSGSGQDYAAPIANAVLQVLVANN